MKVAITGGLGFIGSHLAERFLRAGAKVVIVDDFSGNVVSPQTMTDQGAKVIHTDAEYWTGIDHRSEDFGTDTIYSDDYSLVVHCAAPVGPGLVAHKGGVIARDIIGATSALGHACRSLKIPLVNISSSEVYGVPGMGIAGSELAPVGHDGEFTPRAEYGLAKATADCLLANIEDLRHASVRPFNTVGPRQAASKGFVLPTFCDQAIRNVPLTVYEPDAIRSLTSVHDVTRFIVNHWQRIVGQGGVWNVASMENEIRMADLAQLVINAHIAATGSDGKWVEVDPRERWGDDYAFFGRKNGTKLPNSQKAMQAGWNPHWNLLDIVAETYTWTKENPQ